MSKNGSGPATAVTVGTRRDERPGQGLASSLTRNTRRMQAARRRHPLYAPRPSPVLDADCWQPLGAVLARVLAQLEGAP